MNTYKINKTINKPIEFKGLKAQYIWWLGGGLLLLLILFAVLYICGVNPFICLAIIGLLGSWLGAYVYRISNKHGQFGMMKLIAKKRIPNVVKNSSRKLFLNLNSKGAWKK